MRLFWGGRAGSAQKWLKGEVPLAFTVAKGGAG